jgi:hypothetical protein
MISGPEGICRYPPNDGPRRLSHAQLSRCAAQQEKAEAVLLCKNTTAAKPRRRVTKNKYGNKYFAAQEYKVCKFICSRDGTCRQIAAARQQKLLTIPNVVATSDTVISAYSPRQRLAKISSRAPPAAISISTCREQRFLPSVF